MTELTTKPDHTAAIGVTSEGDEVFASESFQLFMDELEQRLNDEVLGNQVLVSSYTVATLPMVPQTGIIHVSNESGGAVLAFSDGTNWRRVTDRAIVS